MVVLLASLAPAATCPASPELRDDDDVLTVLAQNMQLIAVGPVRTERGAVLGRWLDGPGAAVDLLFLSEGRDLDPLSAAMPDWCLYVQAGSGMEGYRWELAGGERSPGGLVLGVRQRPEGVLRSLDGLAGRVFRARSVSLAEGLLGRLAGFAKGWAGVGWDGARLVWTHAQASYDRHPAAGAGREGVGRAGQMQDLADDLGRSDAPVLVTGDLNALDGFASGDEEIRAAGEVDRGTLDRFFVRTGIRFGRGPCAGGSFLGSVFRDQPSDSAIAGASLDRVGLNAAFEANHPDTRVACAEIAEGRLRVSDHRGLLISVPH